MAKTDPLQLAYHLRTPHGLFAALNGVYREVLEGTKALDNTIPSFAGFDANGAHRDVTLDGAAATDGEIHGLVRVIANRSTTAVNLVCKNQAGTTIVTIGQNTAAVLYHDKEDGWSCEFTFAITLV